MKKRNNDLYCFSVFTNFLLIGKLVSIYRISANSNDPLHIIDNVPKYPSSAFFARNGIVPDRIFRKYREENSETEIEI